MNGNRTSSSSSIKEELTCCHRATCCCACMRDALVTQPVFGCVLEQFTFGTIFWLITVTGLMAMAYAIMWFTMGAMVLPGAPLFGLFGTIVFAYMLGWTLAYIPHLNLPPVFGMLLAGIIVRNAGWYNVSDQIGQKITSQIRNFSVTFVLLRAGLQLTSSGLREHPLFVLNLAVIPCSMELVTVAAMCKFFLHHTWGWAFLCGSMLACMSPVVPVNCMLALADRGYGEDKEIASLLFAAVSIDDVHIVSVYTIFYSFIFSHHEKPKSWLNYIPGGLRHLVIGFVVGTTLGLFFVFFPHRANSHALSYRIIGLILGSLMCTIGATAVTITGGGFLATILMSLIATNGWRILTVPYDIQPLRNIVSTMWHLMQPVLVGLIGAEIDLRNWNTQRLIYYWVVLLLGLLVRSAFAFLATFHTPFSMKERLFIALSWISKGTLQAALGPMTLEQALRDKNDEEIFYATDIARIAVLAILVFSPLGALVMMSTGPHLLNKVTDEELRRRRELSYLKIVSLQPVRRS